MIVVLQVDINDVWTWIPNPIDGYSVSGAYRILAYKTSSRDYVPADLLWRREVPLKVSMFAWRLFWKSIAN